MATVSNRPWSDFSQSDYDPAQWRRACLIHRDPNSDNKADHSLPVKEPSGAINRNGVHAAAGRLSQVSGVSPEQKRAAARRLVSIYRNDLNEDPPASLLRLAGESRSLDGADELREASMSELERRFTSVPVELRASGDRPRIGGYALKFNVYSRNLGGFVERAAPSFVAKSRGDGWPDIMCRYNHDNNMLLGTTDSGTLSLRVDEVGLDYEVNPPDARKDVLELVTRGDVRRSSFGWDSRTTEDDWTLTEQGYPLRTLVSGRLVDVAPCNSAIAAYIDATAGLRSLATKMEAAFEEVRTLAEQDELKKFFVRTDNQGKPKPEKIRLFGPSAAAALLGRRIDPYV